MEAEAGYRFLGYQLDKQQRPTFRYRFGDVLIEDHPKPFSQSGDKSPGLRRTLTLSGDGASGDGAKGDVWYRAAVASSIADAGDGTYRIDNTWTIRLKSTEKPTIRESGGKKELLLPLKFTNGKATIVQEYVW